MSHDDNNGMTIAQEEQAKHVLDKENFDLKMQVQNLAEQLRKSSSWEGGGYLHACLCVCGMRVSSACVWSACGISVLTLTVTPPPQAEGEATPA